MRTAGSYQYPAMESVIYGKPAAKALCEEAERLDARRVYLIVSRTLNTRTDEIEKIREGLGERHAATFDGIPQHTTCEVVVQIAKQAKEAGADLIVAIGGGSVVDAAKIVLMCLEHEIFEQDGLDAYETTPERRFGPFRNLRIRMIAIPSTLSGGEYNSGALVTDTRRKRHGSGAEAGRGCARCTGARRRRGLWVLHRQAWPAAASRRCRHRRGPF